MDDTKTQIVKAETVEDLGDGNFEIVKFDPKAWLAEVGPRIGDVLHRGYAAARAVVDDETYAFAVKSGVESADLEKYLKVTTEKEWVDPARAGWKNSLAFQDALVGKVATLRKLLKTVCDNHVTEKERLARIERERIAAEQRRLEEEERKKREAIEAENRRRQEAYEKAERERLQKVAEEEARRKKEEEDARIKAAESARDAGAADRVDTILDIPTPVSKPIDVPAPTPLPELLAVPDPAAFVPPPLPTVEVPKVEGARRTVRWVAKITDKKALLKAWAEGKVPFLADDDIEIKIGKFHAHARKHHERMSIPGVEAITESDTSFVSTNESKGERE